MATAQLESEAQHGSAAKAAFSLERFCPLESMAPGLWRLFNRWRALSKGRTARPRQGNSAVLTGPS